MKVVRDACVVDECKLVKEATRDRYHLEMMSKPFHMVTGAGGGSAGWPSFQTILLRRPSRLACANM
jgi:hypothetical protein